MSQNQWLLDFPDWTRLVTLKQQWAEGSAAAGAGEGDRAVELDELKRVIYQADPAAVLVSPRVLRRVLQAEYRVPYVLFETPHERCYFFDRQVLFRHVEQDELDLEPDRLLPPTVILLARPSAEELESIDRDAFLLRYWQRLFHIHVHMAYECRQREGLLTPELVRSRIAEIGQTEFAEIRTVLEQENFLLPPADDVGVYIEFVAVYLELRYFRSNLRATYFPAIGDLHLLDKILAQDLDAEVLFERTRLPGSPVPIMRTDTSSDESHDYYHRLMRQADRALRDGDIVRAAILHTRAARVAPADQTDATRKQAHADLARLTEQLQTALKLSPETGQEWLQVLPALLDKADQGTWPVEARLLYDLQKAVLDHQRKLYALDVVEWVLTVGKRPIKRPLSSLQLVHTTKDLRTAARRLTMARVTVEDRQRLVKLHQGALRQSEERLRERFRPILLGAFHDVGLNPSNPPEEVALHKMIEELLDRIAEFGFFSFSDLRDTISRNQLKLPDLADPNAFWMGDALARLDRHLSNLLEGVYRHGEFYLRWMESFSGLFFGTSVGRFITRNMLVPFGGAWAILKALQYMIKPFVGEEGLAPAVLSVVNPAWQDPEYAAGHLPQVIGILTALLGMVFLSVIRSRTLRESLAESGRRTVRATRYAFYDAPLRLWQRPWVQGLLQSWPTLLFYWYTVKPALVCTVVWLIWPGRMSAWLPLVVCFFLADLLLNSRFGSAAGEAVTEALLWFYGWLRFDVLHGLVRWVLAFFKQVTETLEYILYTVDERLRFRSDESRITMALRIVLGVFWFPIGYLIRVYFIMFLEPTLNPIKLPLSSLAFKIMLTMDWYREMLNPATHESYLAPHTGLVLAVALTFTFVIPTMWLLPGVLAFFFWEVQGNWRLFRSNRSEHLRPVAIGRHGETMLRLLKPGVHSGTLPRVYGRLRHAEDTAYQTGDWRMARDYWQALHEIARSVQSFVEREFLALLNLSKTWDHQHVRVGRVMLSCHRIRVELSHAEYAREPIWLVFEQRSGWLLGSLPESGWLKHLTPARLKVAVAALTGLYKIAGVDFVREQLTALLSPTVPHYDLTSQYLVVRNDVGTRHQIAYDLRNRQKRVKPYASNGNGKAGLPTLEAGQLFFSRMPLSWAQWVEYWKNDQAEDAMAGLFRNGNPPLIFSPGKVELPALGE